ncbi:MAG: hypothetical protein AB7O52_05575 [Planctomycetota bacterium]
MRDRDDAILLERHVFDTARLMAEHPPRLRHGHKKVVFELACPPGCRHAGEIRYSRWSALELPRKLEIVGASSRVETRVGVFDYAPSRESGPAVEWHVNFADPHLFVAYGGPLFAQDEMQVAEHPALGAVREALEAAGSPTLTEAFGEPTPVLLMGVERRCQIATDADPAAGRPQGLYGNRFARAEIDVVRRAVTPIDPPTVTNFIAMAAPAGGSDFYDVYDIEKILVTACTGFRAAVRESARPDDPTVVVHTGFWGCGAFGGNRVLMTLLQILAARLAGVHHLVFHTVDPLGVPVVKEACAHADSLAAGGSPRGKGELIGAIEAMGLRWGVSDGN